MIMKWRIKHLYIPEKLIFYLITSLAFFIGLYFLFLGVSGLWLSQWFWIAGIALSLLFVCISYNSISRLALKRSLAFIMLCALITMPIYGVFAVIADQNQAQRLSKSEEVSYFRNLLGRSYNYTELIVWENKHLNFSYGNIQRNDDPIKIFEYGKGLCGEFAILYAELCISQGYRCRIVHNIFGDHVFNEVLETNGTWIRVDASLNDTSSRAIGYPMFFEKEPGWSPPILALAFENSSIVDVTSTYRSDHLSLISPVSLATLTIIFAVCIAAIMKFLVQTPSNSLTKLRSITTESLSKWFLWLASLLIALLFIVFFCFWIDVRTKHR